MIRTCGTCTACCTIMAVDELAKPIDTSCVHCDGTSCMVYRSRPRACREFDCGWLQDPHGVFDEDQRPDKSHVVVHVREGAVTAHCVPGHRKAWKEPRMWALLQHCARVGLTVAVRSGPRWWRIDEAGHHLQH